MLSSHILSEMELLADSIGIIHGGVLLEECFYKKLKEKNAQYILLKAEPIQRVVNIIEKILKIKNYRVSEENTILIYDKEAQTQNIVKVLAGEGIFVEAIDKKEDSLEDYFRRLTGGEGIA